MKTRLWIMEVLVAFDRLGNAVLRGSADETLSSRAHRMRMQQQPVWGWTAGAIDWAAAFFFSQAAHCERAWMYESRRWAHATTEDTAGMALENHMKESA